MTDSLRQESPLPKPIQGESAATEAEPAELNLASLASIDARVEAVRLVLGAPAVPRPSAAPVHLSHPPRLPSELAPFLDHTLLKPDATRSDVLRLAHEARSHRLAGACVHLWHAEAVAQALAGSAVKTVVVVGFPLGATSTSTKAHETHEAIQAGASEVDVVLNIGALKSGALKEALEDLRAVVNAAEGRPVKVILETHLLSVQERVDACVVSELAEAQFIKTSTGFTGGGATLHDVGLMRRAVGDRLKIKASGGVRTSQVALQLVLAGASRLGSSSSLALLSGNVSSGY